MKFITSSEKLLRKIRITLIAFMALLILSGLTAFPVQTELNFLADHRNWFPLFMQEWLLKVNVAVNHTASKYPFLIYGYDWLAFAHIVIAMFFYGVYVDPIRNAWVLRVGMLACLGVFILAFSCMAIRGIPLFWTLIDCSFGLFGMIPLLMILHWTRRLEQLQKMEFTNKHHAL